jgi:sterol 3beta-glucosyltransferase
VQDRGDWLKASDVAAVTGDVQPFIPIGQRLQASGHRVRIATHGNFAAFIQDSGLEFYDIGGDPAQLLEYMVKNPGLMPGMEALRKGDVTKKRKMVKDVRSFPRIAVYLNLSGIHQILDGCWKACYEPDAVTGARFAADAIIANPPSFAHIHCAEALSK